MGAGLRESLRGGDMLEGVVTCWRLAALGSQYHARARGTGVLWGPSKTYSCKEGASGQELWLSVKESTNHCQTEARQGGSRRE